MPNDPVTGPISREEWAELVNAPAGALDQKMKALAHAPEPQKSIWTVEVTGTLTARTTIKVSAETKEQAESIARERLSDLEQDDWDYVDDYPDIGRASAKKLEGIR